MNALATLPAPLANGVPPEEFERTACWMAREFSEATGEISRLIEEIRTQCKRLNEVFQDDKSSLSDFEVRFSHPYGDREDAIMENMTRTAWKKIIQTLGIRNVMSVAKRGKFDCELASGQLPPITEDTIVGMLLGLMGQAQDFAMEAAKEVWEMLRPQRSGYKTNSAFRVGRRVIMSGWVEEQWDGAAFRPCYWADKKIVALDGVFHLLDGKGVMRGASPLGEAIRNTKDGKGETPYFRFKCFKNRNLHLEFRRLDLVQELNLLAVGERVLGEDPP